MVYPSLRLLVQALQQWQADAVVSGAGFRLIYNTLLLACASVVCAGIAGTALAWFLTHFSFPGRGLLAVLAYLPFTLPPLVGVLSFYYLIGRDGLLPRFLERVSGGGDFAIPGFWAILLVHTYSFYVFYYAMAAPAFENMDRAQVEAARTLGASPLRAFFRVTLPQLRPALYGASLLTFMSSSASFSAPYFFGQDFEVLSVAIFSARSQNNLDVAVTLTVVLAMISLLGVLLFRNAATAGQSASKGVRTPVRGVTGRIVCSLLAWACILALLVPHLNIVWLSLVSYRDWHTELIPTVFTLDNYAGLFRNASTLAPIRNSLWMSAVGTVATFAVALPAAYLIARRRRGGRWINLMVMIPWALPGTVIAINLIVAFNERWMPLYNTVWILPVAYFVRNVPLFGRMAGAAIEAFDATLIEAGRTLGASKGYCFWHIVLPLIAPAIAAATALVFATCLGEFVASILLYLPSNIPISVRINMEWRASVGAAFAYSVLLMTLVTATFALSRRFAPRML